MEETSPTDSIKKDVLPFEVVKPSKSYVPEGFKSREDFLAEAREEYELDLDFDRDNREEALEDKKFAAGDQWDPEVLRQRQNLPNLTINTIPQFVAQLVGDWRESKRGIKILPTEDSDREVADILGDLVRSIEVQSRADRVYDNGFESSVICGDGAIRVSIEYARDDVFDQDIFIRPIDDCLAVVWDRLSVDPTGRDARHCFVEDLIPLKTFEKKFPDASPSELGDNTYKELLASRWLEPDGVRVTEYWRMIEREKLLALFEDGSMRFVDDLAALTEKHGAVVKARMSPCLYAQMHLITGFDILSGPYEYKLNRLPIVRMSGRTINVRGNRVRYGIVRHMKDPARLRNFHRSVAAEQLGYAPKAQWIATQSAVEGYEDSLRKAHLSRDPLIVVSDDAVIGQSIQRLDPPRWQDALHQEAAANVQDMKDVTGIHDASLGIRSNETSGKAINARQREGDIASITFYDNGNAAVLEVGDVINQLIPQIYDGTRIIRRVGEDGNIKFTKINDPYDPSSPDLSIGKYDVALATGASYTTRRVEAAQAMMEAVQVYPELMSVAGDLVAKAQDWPGAEDLAKRLQKTIPQQFLDPEERTEPDPQVQQLQMELQAVAMELQQLKMDKEIEAKKLLIDVYKAETERIRALSDHEVDQNSMSMEAIKTIIDAENKAGDREIKAESLKKKESAGASKK